MKTIKIGTKTIVLVRHAREIEKAGKQRFDAGRDSVGNLYLKGKTGRWSQAYQTRELAENILKNA